MTFNKVMFSSVKQDWETPTQIYRALDKEFNFDYDPCPANYTIDGLVTEWKQRNFINPPYKRALEWIVKGYHECIKGKLCVFLMPSRTDTRWWHDYAMKADEIRFIRGRLKFSGYRNSAPFPSCIIVFRGKKTGIGD